MKTHIQNLFIALTILALGSQLSMAFAQGTAFTYQGRLNSGGTPANGSYDLAFTLYTTNITGSTIAEPVTNSAVSVTNGLFTTLIDFGPLVYNGASNWLEIAVSTNGANTFTTLAPRQQLTPAPYALFAEGANAAGLTGTIAPANIANGSITSNLLAGGSVGVPQLTTNIGVWTQVGTNLFYTNGNVSIGTLLSQAPLLVRGNGANNSAAVVGIQITGSEFGAGVFGYSQLPGGNGIRGEADVSPGDGASPIGVLAISGATNGVALYAEAPNTSGPTFGVYGLDYSPDGYAGYFLGRGYFSGNVGIGTTTPNTAMEVAGPSGTSLRLTGPGGSGSTVALDLATYNPVPFGTNTPSARLVASDNNFSADVSIQTKSPGAATNNMQTRLFISNSGKVGIGTVNPPTTLFVQGDAPNSTNGPVTSVQTSGNAQSGAVVGLCLVPGGNGIKGESDTPAIGASGAAYSNCGVYGTTTSTNGTGVYGEAVASSGVTYGLVGYASSPQGYAGYFVGSGYFSGNVGIGTSTPVNPLQMGSGAYCSAAGVWTSVSDRNVKEDFTAITPTEVLAKVAAMPITQWKYKVEPSGIKHIGPVAQDFHSAFGLGDSDKAIGSVDESGVALAAIQGLNQKLEEKDAEIQDLKQRMEKLEQLLARGAAR